MLDSCHPASIGCAVPGRGCLPLHRQHISPGLFQCWQVTFGATRSPMLVPSHPSLQSSICR